MRRYASLRRRADFARVQRRGKRTVGKLFVMLATAAPERSRIGITIARQIGGAVVRNRLRRRVKAVLDRSGFGAAAPHRDVVLIARPGAGSADFAAVVTEIDGLVR